MNDFTVQDNTIESVAQHIMWDTLYERRSEDEADALFDDLEEEQVTEATRQVLSEIPALKDRITESIKGQIGEVLYRTPEAFGDEDDAGENITSEQAHEYVMEAMDPTPEAFGDSEMLDNDEQDIVLRIYDDFMAKAA